MTDVDPFVVQWPEKWITDPQVAPVVQYLNRFLHDLWIRTGGGEDAISEVTGSESFETSTSNGQYIALHEAQENQDGEIYIPPPQLDYECEPLLGQQFNARLVNADAEAVNGDYIEASNGATIKADRCPGSNDVIKIANGDGSSIRFDGNGNNVMYTDIGNCIDIQRKGTSITFQWFDEGPYWRPV